MEPSELVASLVAASPVPLDEAAARAYVDELALRGTDLAGMKPADAALVAACLAGSPAALRELERTLFPAVEQAVSAMGDASFVDEVKQGLRVRLFTGTPERPPALLDYRGRGSLGGWLRVSAVRLALDLKRRHGREVPDADAASIERADLASREPELQHLRARHAEDFRRAFQQALDGLAPGERSLLRFYYVDRLTIDDLAALLRLHRATAARRVTAVRERVVEATRANLRAQLALSTLELESLLGALESAVDVSLAGALGAPTRG